jgi:hypothetical protein
LTPLTMLASVFIVFVFIVLVWFLVSFYFG